MNRIFSRSIDLDPFFVKPKNPVLAGIGAFETKGDGYEYNSTTLALWSAASLIGTGTGAYHGYKRNRGSVGWAIGWGLLGGAFPIITIPVSLAQGFGKPG